MRERSTSVNQLFAFNPLLFATRTKKRAVSGLFPVFWTRKGIPIWVLLLHSCVNCIARSGTQCYNSEVLFRPRLLRARTTASPERETAHVTVEQVIVPEHHAAHVCIDEAMSMLHLLWHSLD